MVSEILTSNFTKFSHDKKNNQWKFQWKFRWKFYDFLTLGLGLQVKVFRVLSGATANRYDLRYDHLPVVWLALVRVHNANHGQLQPSLDSRAVGSYLWSILTALVSVRLRRPTIVLLHCIFTNKVQKYVNYKVITKSFTIF